MRTKVKTNWKKTHWRDKYGTMLLPKNMDERHLLCAIRCCQDYTKDRERKKILQLSAILEERSLPKKIKEEAAEKLSQLKVHGLKIADEFPVYPKLCAEALTRDLIA